MERQKEPGTRRLFEDDASKADLDDAEHWVRVYLDLSRTTRQMIATGLADLPEERRDALRMQAEQFERRLGRWRTRLDELRAEGRGPA